MLYCFSYVFLRFSQYMHMNITFLLVLKRLMFADRLVVTQHALQVLDTGLLCSLSHSCHSAAKRIQNHLHGSLLVLRHFFPGVSVYSML